MSSKSLVCDDNNNIEESRLMTCNSVININLNSYFT